LRQDFVNLFDNLLLISDSICYIVTSISPKFVARVTKMTGNVKKEGEIFRISGKGLVNRTPHGLEEVDILNVDAGNSVDDKELPSELPQTLDGLVIYGANGAVIQDKDDSRLSQAKRNGTRIHWITNFGLKNRPSKKYQVRLRWVDSSLYFYYDPLAKKVFKLEVKKDPSGNYAIADLDLQDPPVGMT
jgi:hypothetical protein